MVTKRQTCFFVTAATAVVAGLAAWIVPSADAQQRKSIRWATARSAPTATRSPLRWPRCSSRRSAGNTPSPCSRIRPPTVSMKADHGGDAEIAYVADIGMTQF